MAATPYKQLEQEWQRLHAFGGALSLLRWDAAVMMPRGSADIRGEQLAAIETEQHAILTSPRVSRLLDRARAGAAALDEWQQANLREMLRQRDHAIATPVSLVARMARATSLAEVRWAEAREKKQFEIFVPSLTEVLQLVRDRAALLGQALNLAPYDALMDAYSPGMRSADIDTMFRALSRRLPSLIREAIERQRDAQALPLSGKFTPGRQRALIVEVMKALGFSFERGRLDESDHPFTEGVAGDIRVTTRLDQGDPFKGLLAAIHETGHALYEQGVPREWHAQPAGKSRGMALEESQALFMEMILARSRPFLTWLRPLLEKHFGVTGPEWEPGNLYRLLTQVHRGAIRIDADELTYPMHVLLRYGIEKDLLDGKLAVRDLPEAWNKGMRDRLEVTPADDAEGCLQDVHWAYGAFGYFPSYAIGALIAAQLHERLRRDTPDLDARLERGELGAVTHWLKEHIHAAGARLPPQELVQSATGKPLSATPSLRYLEARYLEEAR
jgi:carboxypeptidase Taq